MPTTQTSNHVPSSASQEARAFFDQLNRDYIAVHVAKEDLFWATYMAISDDHAGFARAEQAYKAFVSDPSRGRESRRHLAALSSAPDAAAHGDLQHGLKGWVAFFDVNVLDGDAAQGLMAELVAAEAELFARRQRFVVTHVNDAGEREEATLAMLATNQATNANEDRRRSSHDAFRELEHWVLANGYLEIIAIRNRLARALGFRDFFDYKVRKADRMSPEELFAILDDFLGRTEQANARMLAELRSRHGDGATAGWNLRYYLSGDVVRQMDPYVPFGKGLRRWVQSFGRLGIKYRGATMQLDLIERKGKYQNGFCHGPMPTYYDASGNWVPGRINFTAEATPNQVGSGWRALNTLFHEGGHAAHFANVVQNAPCFSQEYAPTSAAYAETQSMFCDSLLDDADWLGRYARNADGHAMPHDLIHARIASRVPSMAFDERSLAIVSYFEAALYAMRDEERTPDAVLKLARDLEARILGVHSPRPLLAIPHLLNQESSASYHGYLLAHMGVYQTRAALLDRLGSLTDNPAVGPLLAEHYWGPGNSVDHSSTLRSLTGEGLSARGLADACNQTVDEAWDEAREKLRAAASRDAANGGGGADSLDATIRIVHGAELITDNSRSDEAMANEFEQWVTERYPRVTNVS
jgi:oligoendopeptidase F